MTKKLLMDSLAGKNKVFAYEILFKGIRKVGQIHPKSHFFT